MNEDLRGDGVQNALTCIHPCIHYTATHSEESLTESEQLQLRNFFQVLADVALAVANQKRKAESGG